MRKTVLSRKSPLHFANILVMVLIVLVLFAIRIPAYSTAVQTPSPLSVQQNMKSVQEKQRTVPQKASPRKRVGGAHPGPATRGTPRRTWHRLQRIQRQWVNSSY